MSTLTIPAEALGLRHRGHRITLDRLGTFTITDVQHCSGHVHQSVAELPGIFMFRDDTTVGLPDETIGFDDLPTTAQLLNHQGSLAKGLLVALAITFGLVAFVIWVLRGVGA